MLAWRTRAAVSLDKLLWWDFWIYSFWVFRWWAVATSGRDSWKRQTAFHGDYNSWRSLTGWMDSLWGSSYGLGRHGRLIVSLGIQPQLLSTAADARHLIDPYFIHSSPCQPLFQDFGAEVIHGSDIKGKAFSVSGQDNSNTHGEWWNRKVTCTFTEDQSLTVQDVHQHWLLWLRTAGCEYTFYPGSLDALLIYGLPS